MSDIIARGMANAIGRIPNTQTWIATEGQTVFTLGNGSYIPNKNLLTVSIGSVLQISGENYIETNSTSFTLTTPLPAGTKVFAKWYEVKVPETVGHGTRHELGGSDEIDVTKLKNYNAISEQILNNANKLDSVRINVKIPFGVGLTAAKGDGVTDDTAAIQAIINYAKTRGITVEFPQGVYLISSSISTHGVKIEGSETSVFSTSAIGTFIKCSTKTFAAFTQGEMTADKLTFSIKNLVIQGADTGLDYDYCVNCTFQNIYVEDCNLALKIGDVAKVGSLFCTFDNIYVEKCVKALELTGNSYVNNNVFINCYFGATGNETASLDCVGGYGAINNVFIATEFSNSFGRGIRLGNTRNTTFTNTYFECHASAVLMEGFSSRVKFNDCVYGSLKNTNTLGDTSFINVTTSGGNFTIDGGSVFIQDVPEQQNLRLFSGTTAVVQNSRIYRQPALEVTPTGWKLSDVGSYNKVTATNLDVANSLIPDLVLRNFDETNGFRLYRNRAEGGTGFGVGMQLNGTSFLSVDESGHASFKKSLGLTAITSSGVANNSFFVDSTTNTLKFKDNSGAIKTVTLA